MLIQLNKTKFIFVYLKLIFCKKIVVRLTKNNSDSVQTVESGHFWVVLRSTVRP